MTINREKIEELLGYTFRDRGLPVQALTHPSYLHESGGDGGDYQRLEFLGDAVLGLLLGELLYLRHADWHEGSLSQLRSRLAGQDLLADRARLLGIGAFILLGRGEEQSAGREKDSILADVLEALIGALYLDGGLQAARTLVVRLFDEAAAAPEELALGRDAKSELQEYLSFHGYSPPEYRLAEESGPPHERLFNFHLYVDDRLIGSGTGKSKKNAQQTAAAMALTTLQSPLRQGGM
ncbi:MAG: ribonuclease III [Desulfuromonadaceae bacterium]|nr:ribonuclease III [Desulfuromonadaceae bacterium]MDD5106248.1 ribonuclease III [Desulfuromonadaceae bacterium]